VLEIGSESDLTQSGDAGDISLLPGTEVDAEGDLAGDAGGPDSLPIEIPTADAWEPIPCQDNGDCDSGFCLPGPKGKACGQPCVEECPQGWVCRQFQSDPDVLFLCVWPHTSLCRPCVTNEECNDPSLPAGNLCVSEGEEGSFCGSQCDNAQSCPQGYVCQEVSLPGGTTTLQCVGLEECTCSAAAIAEEAFTICTVTNDLGSCKGMRKCTADGLGDCDAPPAAAEACNGKDDDCDGVTDGEDAQGCEPYFDDSDKDGFGKDSAGCFCGPQPGLTSVGGDCDDGNPAVFPGANEVCNGKDVDCDGQTDEKDSFGCMPLYPDTDGDGYGAGQPDCVCPGSTGYTPGTGDCDDKADTIHPGATETCNDKDDDCDGTIDEENAQGCQTWYVDEDGDGIGQGAQSKCLCAPAGAYTASVPGDCADQDPESGTGLPELCDGKDNDCDGLKDEAGAEGCSPAYKDIDGDGWGGAEGGCFCGVQPGLVSLGGDCDDGKPTVHPDAAETCGNNLDDDCDGEVNEAGAALCVDRYADADGDGFGAGIAVCVCPEATGYAPLAGDCDDTSPQVSPAGMESCNGIDDDCDGAVDEKDADGCQEWYVDQDGDGLGNAALSACLCGPDALHTTLVPGDCDDMDKGTGGGAPETCDGKDNDCDGVIDEADAAGCVQAFVDADKDGWGGTANTCVCKVGDGTSATGGDCDDLLAAVHPGAVELCNGLDDDCDGKTDPVGAAGCLAWYPDGDGDGFGDSAAAGQCQCAASPFFPVNNKQDCNDGSAAVKPGAVETCNGIDDNCDGVTDPENAQGCQVRFLDGDADGYGGNQSACVCPATPGYVGVSGDCNDGNASVKPGAVETCNGIDDNCDGQTDPASSQGCQVKYVDGDGDGYGSSQSACVCPATPGYAGQSGDCNDGNAAVKPGAAENCNGIDDNCDGSTDPAGSNGCTTYFKDADFDGYGDKYSQSQCLCSAVPPYNVTNNQDCNDGTGSVKPGATETCNGQDDNCDGQIDPENSPGCSTKYYDNDVDGYGVNQSKCLCAAQGKYSASQAGDCNDDDATMKPGYPEQCDAKDNDCNGKMDDNGACFDTVYRYLYSSGNNSDHFYTTDPSTPPDYSPEGPVFKVAKIPTGGINSSIIQLYSPGGIDHFYTTSSDEALYAQNNLGYQYEGQIGACASEKLDPSMVPLHRLWSASASDHFYTTSDAEKNAALAGGYVYESVTCWVWPPNWP
jgi:hypothetical protein